MIPIDAMKLGISSYTYTWAVGVPGSEPQQPWNAFRLLEKAGELGADCLQIADNLPLHAMPEEQLNELRHRSEEPGIDLEAGARGMTPEMLETYIGIAERLNSRILRFVIDGPGFTPAVPEVIRIVRGALPALEEKGVVLAIENHDRLKAEEFLEIVESAGNERVGICLDSVNSMGAGEGIGTVTGVLAPHVVNLHIKDFIVKRHPHRMGFTIEGRPAGRGQLPLARILEMLEKKCRSAILELWTPPEKRLADTLEKEDAWARESVKYLRNTFFTR